MTPIRTDSSNKFAHYTVTVRLPAMIDQMLSDNPDLSAAATASLRQLRAELISNAPLRMFDPPAPDHETWAQLLADHERRLGHRATWQNSEWFVLEHFYFRRILAAADYWQTKIDPFAPAKARELASPALAQQVDSLLEASRESGRDREFREFVQRLCFALWGNRMDLSHSESMSHADAAHHDDSLIIDESSAVWEVVRNLAAPVHFVCDNAGTELAADLFLADWLIRTRNAPVSLHLKAHPTFVGDATEADVHALIDRLGSPAASTVSRALSERLVSGLDTGELLIVPDLFWNSPLFFNDLPDRILTPFAEAGLIIIKGDMNYRRLLNDTIVPATDPLSSWAPPMPAPTVMLRTMKGDPIAGLDPARLNALDSEHPGWRTAGKHGVIQVLAPGTR